MDGRLRDATAPELQLELGLGLELQLQLGLGLGLGQLLTDLFGMPDLSLLLLLAFAGSAIASLWHVLCQRRFVDATLTSP